MNIVNVTIILTILVVFFIYISYYRKKQHKKEGYIDSYFTPFHSTVVRSDLEVSKKETELNNMKNELAIIMSNLDEVRNKINLKKDDLFKLRLAQDKLQTDFKDLLDNMDILKSEISKYINNDDIPFIDSTLNVFDLERVRDKKDEMINTINTIKNSLNNDLAYYGETDISTLDKIKNESTGLIQEFEKIKDIYNRIYKILKNNTAFMEVCSGYVLENPRYPQYVKDYITDEFDHNHMCKKENTKLDSIQNEINAKTSTNFELGESICESKEGTCIYENNRYFPKSYAKGSYSYVFHKDRWPLEDSCEAQTSNCFSFDTLGADACKDLEIPLWFINPEEKGEYYTSNVGYVPLDLRPGLEWVCDINLAKENQIHNKSDAAEIAEDNCLGNNRGYGVTAYDCWNVSDGDIDITHQVDNKKSKMWSDTDINSNGSYGKCEINTTCRRQIDTQNHVNCLKQDFLASGNFECWEIDEANNISSTSHFRNYYTLGQWNSNDNQNEMGYCTTKIMKDCRTKFDVEAQADCLTNDNWTCGRLNFQPHASNIGHVEVMNNGNQMNKSYTPLNYNEINIENKGRGVCVTRPLCLNPEELNREMLCHNDEDNYRCWTVNGDHSASLTMNDMYKIYNKNDGECVTNNTCLSKDDALSIAEEACHASETDRCYSIDNDIIHEDGSIGFTLSDDENGYTEGRLTKFVEASDTRSVCQKRTCPSSKESLCQSLSVSCYLDNPGNLIKTNANGTHNMETVNMEYNQSLDKCVIPETCKQIPYCSYNNVLTGSSTSFNIEDVNGLDCSAGEAYGVKHTWMLESSSQDSINNPMNNTNDLYKWTFIGDNAENSSCVRDPSIPNTSIPPPISEETNEFTCQCTENNYSSDMHYFINDDFSDNNGSGFESVEDICGPNDCGERTYHQAKVRLISCYGEKYKDVTSNVGTYNCIKHAACRRKCLNIGQIDGEPIIVPNDQNNIQCYAPVTNDQINKFSYDETLGTCSSNDCSDTLYGGCPYQSIGDNDGWGTREIVTGTDNKNNSFNHNPVDGEIFRLVDTELLRDGNTNTINYDTRTDEQEGCPDRSDHTVPDTNYTKKSVYKYTRTVTQDNDGVCVQVPDKKQVKYTIENDDTPCPKDCVYYWETDSNGNPIYGDCSSNCREMSTSSVTKTQNYLTRQGNSVSNSTCPTPTQDELDSHTVTCESIPLCCNPNDGIWGDYDDCPLCTTDGVPFTLTRSTTGRITCDPATGVADYTENEQTKSCNPNICGSEVPGTSGYSDCSESSGSSCTLNGNSFTKPGTRIRSYKVYSSTSTGQTDQSDNPEACSINCTNPSPPNGLTFTAKTFDSITITWNAGSRGDATLNGYDILFDDIKHNIGLVTTNTYTLTGLLPSSRYQIKVQKITNPPFANLFSNQIEVRTDQPNCGPNQYSSSFTHNGSIYDSLADVPCESTNCGNMNVTKVYSPNDCNGSRANETVTKNCGYCVSTTGSSKFFHILFHNTNDVINTNSISDLRSQFRFLVCGDQGSLLYIGKTPNEMETLPQYHKEFVTFELTRCYQCNKDKVLQVILTKQGGSVKSNANGNLYIDGGHQKLAYHQDRVVIPYNNVMYIEHELERVGGFGDNTHKSAIYYIKNVTNSTYAKVNRGSTNGSALTWVSSKANATQFVITNNGLLLREGYWDGTNRGNQPKRDTGNYWQKMTTL